MTDENGSTRRTFFLLLGIVFFAFAAYEWCRAPLTAWYAASFGVGESFLGFIVGASTITGILLKYPAGALSDRLGRKPVLCAGLGFFAFTPLAYGLATSPWILLAIRFAHGCATAIYGPVAMAVIADVWRDRRGEALGWYSALGSSGKALGTAGAGFVFASTAQFPITYLCAVPFGVVALALGLSLRLPPPAAPRSEDRGRMDAAVLFTAVTAGVMMIATGAIQAFLPIYARDVRGLSPERTGLLFSAQILTALLSKPIMGRISDRVGRKPMIVGGMLLGAAAFAGVAAAHGFVALAALAAVYGLAEAIVQTSTAAFAADLCRERSLGKAMGSFGAISDVGHACGPILTGWALVLLHRRFDWTFPLIAGLVALFAAAFAIAMRRK